MKKITEEPEEPEKDHVMLQRKTSDLFIPSLADIIFISIFLCLALSKGQGLLADGDTGFHIRAGEYIINTLSVPKYDLFSFITPTLPWTAHEWLAEVIMAFLHSSFGLTGIVVFFSLLIALVHYLLFRDLRSSDGNIFIAAGITILVITTSQIHWLARPHIFSLLIMVVWYRILDNYQYREKNQLFLLPLLMLLWVNLHGGYLAGFILLGIYCVGNYLMGLSAAPDDRTVLHGKSVQILKMSLVSLLASLANPIGYKILLFPLNLINNKYVMDHVTEFLSPNFHDLIIFKYLFLLTIGLLSFSRKRLNVIELMLLLVFTHMALFAARYATLFALVIAPIIVTRADDMLTESDSRIMGFFRIRAARFASMEITARGILWPAGAFLAVVVFLSVNNITYQFNERQKPVAAVEFLIKEHISGNMYNNDEFGDYIIYVAWPQYRVFVDSRWDMYGPERMKEYLKIQNSEPGWEKVLEKYDIDWIIFDARSALSRYLLVLGVWRLVYADTVAHIFVREIPKYRPLIERYGHVKPLAETVELSETSKP
jgi:hypothetical protein